MSPVHAFLRALQASHARVTFRLIRDDRDGPPRRCAPAGRDVTAIFFRAFVNFMMISVDNSVFGSKQRLICPPRPCKLACWRREGVREAK